jgi:hypothetical protein
LGPPSSDNPISGLADLYRALEIEDPWGLGGFFIYQSIYDSEKEIRVNEEINDMKVNGVRTKNIVSRETVATVDGMVVYFELIQNDVIVQRFVNFRDPTIIHETLARMIQNNEDPAVTGALNDIVTLIDLNFQKALDDGVLDPCSYSFIYRKINANVLENCLDKAGNTQDFTQLSRFDPFDDVNQVELSEPVELITSLPNAGYLETPFSEADYIPTTNEILMDYQQGIMGGAQNFMMGFVFPAYLLSLLGVIRIF